MDLKDDKNKKKVFCITRVKNEEDIIESFIRYNLIFFDGIIVMDNCSSDKTLEIIQHLIDEGLPLTLLHDPETEHLQHIKMTEMLYYAMDKFDADIIFPLDADEFIYSKNGDSPYEIIQKLDLGTVYYISTLQYCPDYTDNYTELFIPRRFRYCHNKGLLKVVLGKEITKKHNLSLTQGNHDIKPNSNCGSIRSEALNKIGIAHYPIRSPEQIMSKTLIGRINNISRYDLWSSPSDGVHRVPLYNKIKNDINFLKGDFVSLAKEYLLRNEADTNIIYSPIDLSFCKDIEIKFTPKDPINPIKNLLENCELLALNYADVRRKLNS